MAESCSVPLGDGWRFPVVLTLQVPCALWAAVIEHQRLGSLWIVEVSLPPCVNTPRSKH